MSKTSETLNYWLNLDQTKALIEELKKPSAGIPAVDEIQPVISVPGAPSTGGGTFVRRELVYGYAMWISPAFHLTVIRTFDEQAADLESLHAHAAIWRGEGGREAEAVPSRPKARRIKARTQ